MLKKESNPYREIKKLNLGSGVDYREGYVNIDIGGKNLYGKDIKVDVIHDLNKFPYPFKDNTFDFVFANQILEHLENPKEVLSELYRICKDKCKVIIQVPHFSSYKSFGDWTHKHYYALDSIDSMNPLFKKIKKEFHVGKHWLVLFIGNILTQSPFLYERFLWCYFPIQGITWTLNDKK